MAHDRITFGAKDLKAFLECPICYEGYSHSRPPKLFHCSHTICGSCVGKLTIRNADQTIQCPLCREPHTIPEGGLSTFPTNVTLLHLLSLRSLDKCDDCQEETTKRKCTHCGKNLCQICQEAHRLQTHNEVQQALDDVRGAIERIDEVINEVQDASNTTKENADSLKNHVTDVVIKLVLALGERKAALIKTIDDKLEQAERKYKKIDDCLKCKALEMSNYCDSIEESICTDTGDGSMTRIRGIKSKCQTFVREVESLKFKEYFIKCTSINQDEWCTYIGSIGSISLHSLPLETMDQLKVPLHQPSTPEKTSPQPSPRSSPVPLPKMTLYSNKNKILEHIVPETWMPDAPGWKPRGVAVCPNSGQIVVTDQLNHLVHVFDSEYKKYRHLNSFGGEGCGIGLFRTMCGVAVNRHNEIVMCDYNCSRLQVFQKSGQFLRTITWHQEMKGPYSVAVDEMDQMYVVDRITHHVLVFDRFGKPLFKFNTLCNKRDSGDVSASDLYKPMYLAVNKHCTAITDGRAGSHRIQLLNKDKALLYDLTASSSSLASVTNPGAIAIDGRGNLVVLEDGHRKNIKVFDKTGALIAQSHLEGNNESKDPPFMAITRRGDILITSTRAVLLY